LPHGLGIKIYSNYTGQSPSDVVASHYWWVAAKAMNVMNRAKTKGIAAPKAYCVVPVKFHGKWAVGLVMEHIEGKHKNISDKKWDKLYKKLERHGVQYSDAGSHNWIVQESGRIVLIDWDWTSIRKGKR
jgi:RIO-like serine/threonine protein kinase